MTITSPPAARHTSEGRRGLVVDEDIGHHEVQPWCMSDPSWESGFGQPGDHQQAEVIRDHRCHGAGEVPRVSQKSDNQYDPRRPAGRAERPGPARRPRRPRYRTTTWRRSRPGPTEQASRARSTRCDASPGGTGAPQLAAASTYDSGSAANVCTAILPSRTTNVSVPRVTKPGAVHTM